MKLKAKRPLWASLAAVFVLLTAALIFLYWRYPLELKEWQERRDLKARGVSFWPAGRFPYELWVYDRCSREASGSAGARSKAARNCVCTLWIHGAADSALTWRKVITGPRDQGWSIPVRVWAPTLEEGTPRSQARALSEMLRSSEAEPCRKWTVLGNSRGGWVAMWLALDDPERVNRLLLFGSVGLSGLKSDFDWQSDPTPEKVQEFLHRAYAEDRKTPRRILEAVVRRMKRERKKETLEEKARRLSEPEFLDGKLGELKVPTFIVAGEQDRIAPPEWGRELSRQIRGSTFKLAPRCAHLIQKECPDVFFQALSEAANAGAF